MMFSDFLLVDPVFNLLLIFSVLIGFAHPEVQKLLKFVQGKTS